MKNILAIVPRKIFCVEIECISKIACENVFLSQTGGTYWLGARWARYIVSLFKNLRGKWASILGWKKKKARSFLFKNKKGGPIKWDEIVTVCSCFYTFINRMLGQEMCLFCSKME